MAEDHAQLRDLTKNVLEGHGCTVIGAVDGEDAMAKFIERKENIHLTVLDVIMRKKNGRDVYEEIIKVSPGVKVLFTSRYPEDVFNKHEIMRKGACPACEQPVLFFRNGVLPRTG